MSRSRTDGSDSEPLVKLNLEPAERFEQYLSLLLKWNARTNLTSVREPDEIVRRHFAESIFAAQRVPHAVKTLLDFGSGAGLPGIPIAICRPEITVTLAESQGKKAAFLREAVRTLELKAEVWAGRVEAMPAQRVFDAVTLRAVDKMRAACRMAVERLADGGWIGVFATRATEETLRAVPGIQWGEAAAIPGAEQAVLLEGRR
ncbi:MAG: 16S rRNA (guanine(527)-N(7))-methyltransferase RsmG [Acidobacteriaceae bacterium]